MTSGSEGHSTSRGEMPPEAAPASWEKLGRVAGGIASVAAFVLARQLGLTILIPGVISAIAIAILHRAGPLRARPFAVANGLVLGQLGWMIIGAIAVETVAPVLADLVVFAALVCWLVLAPGRWSACVMGGAELLVLGVNVFQATQGDDTTLAPLAVHMLLRVGAIVGLVVGYRAFRVAERERRAAEVARTL